MGTREGAIKKAVLVLLLLLLHVVLSRQRVVRRVAHCDEAGPRRDLELFGSPSVL
jgi:hypothetical protein